MGSCMEYFDMKTIVAVLLLAAGSQAGLLGAGTGGGSCRAAPYRAVAVQWGSGCPQTAPCCSEYGYCRTREEWQAGGFRDCNGQSNGTPLPADAVNAELTAASYGDSRGVNLLGTSVPPVGSVVLGGVPGNGLGGAPGGGAAGAGFGIGLGGTGAYGGGSAGGISESVLGGVSTPGSGAASAGLGSGLGGAGVYGVGAAGVGSGTGFGGVGAVAGGAAGGALGNGYGGAGGYSTGGGAGVYSTG